MALGAQARDVLGLVLQRRTGLILLGTALGGVGSATVEALRTIRLQNDWNGSAKLARLRDAPAASPLLELLGLPGGS